MTADGHEKSLGDDGNVLQLDCGDGFITINLLNSTESHIKF